MVEILLREESVGRMSVISIYTEYVAKINGNFEQKEDNVERLNYISKDDLMLRGNNRENTYNSAKVTIDSSERKR